MSSITDCNIERSASADATKAANKLQAAFRGYTVRIQLDPLQKATSQVQSAASHRMTSFSFSPQLDDDLSSPKSTPPDTPYFGSPPDPSDEEAAAAIKIQAAFRGYSARKKMQEQSDIALKIQSLLHTLISKQSLEEKENAAVKIQAVWKGYCMKKQVDAIRLGNYIEFLKGEGKYFFSFLQDLQNRAMDSFFKRVIDQDQYNVLLDELQSVATKFKDFNHDLEKNAQKQETLNRREFTEKNQNTIEEIHENLLHLCRSLGFKDLLQGLDVTLGTGWEEGMDEVSCKALHFFNEVFVPTAFTFVEVEAESENTRYLKDESGNIKADFSDNLSKGIPFPTDFRFFKANSLYNKLFGGELCIPIDRKNGKEELLVLKGHFANDPLNIKSAAGWLGRKREKITKELKKSFIPQSFLKQFIEQYSVKDLVLKNPQAIGSDAKEAWNELNRLKGLALTVLVKEFASASLEGQLRILSLLIMDTDNPHGYFLYTMVGKDSPEYKSILRRCLHYSIQKKLDLKESEIEALKKKLLHTDGDISPEDRVLASAMNDIAKAKAMEKAKVSKTRGAESDKAEAWLNGILKVPFGKYTPEPVNASSSPLDIKKYMDKVRNILDDSVHGHEDAKNSLLRVVGQWVSNGNSQGEVIALQGPPGNGKTTFAKEGIAKALDRPFGFLPLGGVTDSSYLIGHDYTYVGSTWGRIADILIESGTMNPVIYIDELDKVSQTEKGREIIGVLTHLTDSSQNKEFRDKFFSGIDLDLSKALIVCSYNDESAIDPILKDRMITIRTKGHATKDKLVIAQDYLLPSILKTVGFKPGELTIDKEDVKFIVDNYTMEAQDTCKVRLSLANEKLAAVAQAVA